MFKLRGSALGMAAPGRKSIEIRNRILIMKMRGDERGRASERGSQCMYLEYTTVLSAIVPIHGIS